MKYHTCFKCSGLAMPKQLHWLINVVRVAHLHG